MKLRIRGDTLRLRLKKNEVERIAAGASIVEETYFPGSVLKFRLDASESIAITASFDNSGLAVNVPKSKALDWADTDDVSLHTEQRLPGAGCLSILIEKDFKCLEPGHHRDCEDDEDTFPHPSAQSKSA